MRQRPLRPLADARVVRLAEHQRHEQADRELPAWIPRRASGTPASASARSIHVSRTEKSSSAKIAACMAMRSRQRAAVHGRRRDALRTAHRPLRALARAARIALKAARTQPVAQARGLAHPAALGICSQPAFEGPRAARRQHGRRVAQHRRGERLVAVRGTRAGAAPHRRRLRPRGCVPPRARPPFAALRCNTLAAWASRYSRSNGWQAYTGPVRSRFHREHLVAAVHRIQQRSRALHHRTAPPPCRRSSPRRTRCERAASRTAGVEARKHLAGQVVEQQLGRSTRGGQPGAAAALLQGEDQRCGPAVGALVDGAERCRRKRPPDEPRTMASDSSRRRRSASQSSTSISRFARKPDERSRRRRAAEHHHAAVGRQSRREPRATCRAPRCRHPARGSCRRPAGTAAPAPRTGCGNSAARRPAAQPGTRR